MKQYRPLFLALALCLLSVLANAGNGFATQRLQKIASEMYVIRFDTLLVGTHEVSFNGRYLNVRVNRWNEVEHIGLKLFSRQNLAGQQQIAFDFMERYLLELLMEGSKEQAIERMGRDKVFIEVGELTDFFSLSDTDNFALSYLGFKGYRMAWEREGNLFLAVSFPMDYQLMSGCNAIELENNYLRDIRRYSANKNAGKKPYTPSDTTHIRYSVDEGGSYLSGAIRHDLYYEKDSLGWSLLCNKEKPYWSAYNIALSSVPVGDFTLTGLLDKYGYETESFTMPLNEWIAYCEEDGWKPYFGIKSKDSDVIKGTVLVPYEDKGFCHMMKLEIPLTSIEQGKGEVRGRLFVFVPLHNLYEGYFDYQFIPRKDNHE